MRSRFNRAVRLNQARDFSRAFRSGYRLKQGCLWVYVCSNQLTFGRLGVIVPKKIVKLSTSRHRLKRILRESFRLNQASLQGQDIVIRVVSKPPTEEQLEANKKEVLLPHLLNKVWKKLNVP